MAFKPGHPKIPGSGMRKGQRIRRWKDWPSEWLIRTMAPRDFNALHKMLTRRKARLDKTWHKRQIANLLAAARQKYPPGTNLAARYDDSGILTLYRIEPDGGLTPILDHGIELSGV